MTKRSRKEMEQEIVELSSSEYDNTDSDSELEESNFEPPKKKQKLETFINIDYKQLTTLESLINLVNNNQNIYNKDLLKLQIILPELKKLQQMIGMNDVKKAITYQVLFFIQNLEITNMMHTVIQGPPGCGKTTLAKILAKIYLKLGFLTSDKFIIAKRSDLIGEYLGQTAKKTQRIIDKARGGVLFIDEAYSLGNQRNGDSYSKECIDTLNQNLSEHPDFVCIIAGYKTDLQKCFFSKNQGLERRFPWIYEIQKYNNQEMYEIFIKLIVENGWNIEVNSVNPTFFEKNKDYFPHFGGSLETLYAKIKMTHSQRVFGQPQYMKKILNKEDIERGFELFVNFEKKNEKINQNKPPPGMYL